MLERHGASVRMRCRFGRDIEHELRARRIVSLILWPSGQREDAWGGQTRTRLCIQLGEDQISAPSVSGAQLRAHVRRCLFETDEFAVGVPDGQVAADGARRLDALAAQEFDADSLA